MNPLNLIPAPYRLIATVALLAAFIGGVYAYAYHAGYKRATDAASTEKLKSVERAIEQAEAIARQDNEIARQNMATTTQIRYRTRLIQTKESAHALANPLPDNCILDPVRMRNINAALSGTLPADLGEFNYALSAPAANDKK